MTSLELTSIQISHRFQLLRRIRTDEQRTLAQVDDRVYGAELQVEEPPMTSPRLSTSSESSNRRRPSAIYPSVGDIHAPLLWGRQRKPSCRGSN